MSGNGDYLSGRSTGRFFENFYKESQISYKKMGLSVEEAMDTLEIAADDRQACVEYMASQLDAE